MIRDALLAMGLLLSTATQLRVPGLPLGPGETLLAVWILGAGAEAMVRRAPPLTPGLQRLLIFWAVFSMAECIGLVTGLAIENYRDDAGAVKTTVAYTVAALLSLLVVALPDWRLHRIAWMMAGIGAAAVTLLIAGGYGVLPVPGLYFWVFHRFIGWSLNPNQFGLLCTVLVLLCLHIAESEERPRLKLLALACVAPPFVGGIITRSDSFFLAVLLAAPLIVGVKFLGRVFFEQRRSSLATMIAGLVFLAAPALLASAAPFAPRMMEVARNMAVATMDQNDQAANRFTLWREATEIGLGSGMLGLGPGPHLVGSREWKLAPPNKGEAHNTIFDLFTQGGLVASLAFLWITGAAFLAAHKKGMIALAYLVFSLFVFSNFHLVARHPIFWFTIALAFATADAIERRRSGGQQPRHLVPPGLQHY